MEYISSRFIGILHFLSLLVTSIILQVFGAGRKVVNNNNDIKLLEYE